MAVENKRNYSMTFNINSNVKTSNMEVYNTDANIFDLKVYIEVPDGRGTRQLEHDELVNYGLKMQIVKPVSNQYKEVQGVLDGTEGFYLFELPKNCWDVVGTYKCQLIVTDNKGTDGDSTDDEIVTSKDFKYTVKASILTGLNPAIVSNPDLPVLEQLINEVKLVAGLTIDDPNTFLADLQVDGVNTTDKTIKGAINELEAREYIERGDLTVSNNAVTLTNIHYPHITVSDDTTVNLPTDLEHRRIVLYVDATTKDSILTFKYTKDADTGEMKFKLAQDSLNIFEIDCNGKDFVIGKGSNKDATLTEAEEQQGILI